MSFLAELKQRRVVRVAMVYLVVAWVAIQAASIALPAFEAPAWTLRVVILLFALGLPLALLLAWALDLTSDGVKVATGKVGNKRMAGICVGLVVLALGWYFHGQPAFRNGRSATAERSVAVLPFVNLSGNPANDYFSDGLAETTLDMLAQVPDLKVIARSSSFAFKGRPTDMREIGKQLGAAHLLEGSVQQVGGTVRITVQLVRAKDGAQVWSKRYDRRLTDVFLIQDEIAASVVDALALELPESTHKRLVRKRTDSVAAFDAYLKGIALLPRRDVPEMRRALVHFEHAIRIDPTFARAYVGAHDALFLLDIYGNITEAERRTGQAYLERALQLSPDLGEAQVARGASLEGANDLEGAEAAYRRGLALAPGYATGWQRFAELLSYRMGRYDEALRYFDQARALDPLSPIIRSTHAFALGQAGRLDEALAEINQLIADEPNMARSYSNRSAIHTARGDLVSALRDYQRVDRIAPDAFGLRVKRCYTLLDFGALDAADACLRPLAARVPDQPGIRFAQARLSALRGDWNAARGIVARLPDGIGDEDVAAIAMRMGNPAALLAIQRRQHPHWFDVQPIGVYAPDVYAALDAGNALFLSGDHARGEALLRAAMATVAKRPYAAFNGGRAWTQVQGNEHLGNREEALRALQHGVDAGYFQGIADLDCDPLLAALRKDPRYDRTMAPARAKATAQIEAARAAGLL